MKKTLALILALTLVLALAGCGQTAAPEAQSAAPAAEATAAPEKAVTLKIGCEGSEASNDCKIAVKIAELINTDPTANIDAQVFSDSTLGNLRDMIEGLSLNTVDIVLGGLNGYENICSNMGVFSQWMIESPEKAIELYQSEVGQKIFQQLVDQNGIRMLSYCNCISGTTYLWGNEPRTTLASYKGVDIRTNNSAANIAALSSFGANPVVLGFADVYNALQTGLIDMTWGSIPVVINGGQGEVLTYIMPAPANFTAGCCAISETAWSGLSEHQQQVVKAAVEEACQVYGDQLHEEALTAEESLLAGAGVERVEMDAAEYEEMCRLVLEATVAHLGDTCDADILSAANEIVAH